MSARLRRSRVWQSVSILLVIAAGLLWRSSLLNLPGPVAKYGGSALWALLVFLICGWFVPRGATSRLAVIATAFACLVEFSQLYHAPWIDAIRGTRFGALTLGSVFNWPDIPAYLLGIIAGVIIERSLGLAREARDSKAR